MHTNSSIIESVNFHLYRYVIACISFSIIAVTLSSDFITINFVILKNKNESIVISNKSYNVSNFYYCTFNIIFTAIVRLFFTTL